MDSPLKIIGNREKISRNQLQLLTKPSRLMLFRNVNAIYNIIIIIIIIGNYIKNNLMMELHICHSALNDTKASEPISSIYTYIYIYIHICIYMYMYIS